MTRAKCTVGIAKVVKHMLYDCETLSSTSSPTQKKDKGKNNDVQIALITSSKLL
jgi:hypothetical protein